jgi:hypothetical protein
VTTDIVLLLGLVLLLHQVRSLVDISYSRVFVLPGLAVVVGAFIGWGVASLAVNMDIVTLGLKVAGFIFGYSLMLLIFERQDYLLQLQIFRDLLIRRNTELEKQA